MGSLGKINPVRIELLATCCKNCFLLHVGDPGCTVVCTAPGDNLFHEESETENTVGRHVQDISSRLCMNGPCLY